MFLIVLFPLSNYHHLHRIHVTCLSMLSPLKSSVVWEKELAYVTFTETRAVCGTW